MTVLAANHPQLFPAIREINRANTLRGRETYFINFKDIICLPEKNKRLPQNYGDIKGLANSIYYNGMEVPLKVDAYVDAEGNYKVFLNDGWRRYTAITSLHEEDRGENFEHVECFINPKETTNEQRILTMFTTQDNKQLEPIEQAACFKELRDLHNYTSSEIGIKVGKTRMYVDDYLKLADESEYVKEAVASGKIKPSAAIELHKKEKNVEKRKEIVEQQVTAGKTKVSDFREAAKPKKHKTTLSGSVKTSDRKKFVPPLFQMEIPTPSDFRFVVIGLIGTTNIKYLECFKNEMDAEKYFVSIQADSELTYYRKISKIDFAELLSVN